MKDFEWDENKRQINLEKHSIDFIDAIDEFDDPNGIEFESIPSTEKRYQIIGTINDVVILLVYTYRGKKKRVISARKASKKERDVYYSLR